MQISRLSALVALATGIVSLPTLAAAESSPRGQVQIGPDFGIMQRQAQANGSGIEYGPGITYGAHAQLLSARWLRFSLYYLHARQPLEVPGGAFGGFQTAQLESGFLTSYVLGARLQPTLNLGSRLHLWVSAGAGWGKVTAPAMTLESTSPERSALVAPREGVVVELPFGVGGSFDIIERWLAVSVDATYTSQTKQSGSIYGTSQAVDSTGQLVEIGPLPKLGPGMTATASIVIEL